MGEVRQDVNTQAIGTQPLTAPSATPETIQTHIQRWREDHRKVPPALYRNRECLCIHCDGPRWIHSRGEPYNLRFSHTGDTCPYCGSDLSRLPGIDIPGNFYLPLARVTGLTELHWCAACQIHH